MKWENKNKNLYDGNEGKWGTVVVVQTLPNFHVLLTFQESKLSEQNDFIKQTCAILIRILFILWYFLLGLPLGHRPRSSLNEYEYTHSN